MNVYEKKFKECYHHTFDRIDECGEKMLKYAGELETYASLEKAFIELKGNKHTSKEVVDALQKVIDRNNIRKDNLNAIIENVNSDYANLQRQLSFLKNRLCPHEHIVFDSVDYHKGVDIFRCKLCGSYL